MSFKPWVGVLVFSMLMPSLSYASKVYTTTQYGSYGADTSEIEARAAAYFANYAGSEYPYTYQPFGEMKWANGKWNQAYSATYYYPEPTGKPTGGSGGGNTPIYNSIYSDSDCQAEYGSSGTMLVSNDDFGSGTIHAGACNITFDGVSLCSGYSSSGEAAPEGSCYLTAEWKARSSGDKNTPSNAGSSVDTTTPDYLTETSDPSTCSGGYYGSGGKTYCVDPSKVKDQNVIISGDLQYPDTSSGGSSGGGSTGGGTSSGGSTGGGSGSGGSSGGGSGGGVIGGGGSGSGTDLSGVISAINSVRDSIRSGFDGLADSITDGMQDKLTEEGENPDDLVEGAGIDDAFDEMEQSAGSVNGRLENLVKGNEIGSGADSGLTDQLKGYLPSFGGSGGCTPLQFFPGEIYAFTVDCVVFDKAKLYLSWLLYVWTVYTILDIFFATAPRRA